MGWRVLQNRIFEGTLWSLHHQTNGPCLVTLYTLKDVHIAMSTVEGAENGTPGHYHQHFHAAARSVCLQSWQGVIHDGNLLESFVSPRPTLGLLRSKIDMEHTLRN